MLTEEHILELADRAYRCGDAAFEVDRSRCVLLVIDMQDEFVRPGWTSSWVPMATSQVPAIRSLIQGCRTVGIPVVFTLFGATHHFWDRPETGAAMPNRFLEVPPGEGWFQDAQVWHELRPEPGDVVIHKSSYGAFFDTPLETILKRMKKDTLIVSGTLANCCCGMTARQGYERGFKVLFGSDVTSTYTEEMQNSELSIQRFAFSKVRSLQEILTLVGATADWTATEEPSGGAREVGR